MNTEDGSTGAERAREKQGSRSATVEAKLKKLEAVLEKLEDEDTPLEASFALYGQGMKLVKEINEKIDRVEKEITVLEGEEDE